YELFVVVGMIIILLFAKWLHKGNFSTIPEIFTRIFGNSRVLLALIAIAVILVPFGWLATQFVAFASLFGQVTGIAMTPLIIVMALISVLFVLPGGLTSVAWSDFFFGVFMVIGSFIVAGFAIQRAGGLGEIFRNVPSEIAAVPQDRKSTRLNSSHVSISSCSPLSLHVALPISPLIIVMALISVLFVLPGGLTSVAWSDFFFGVFMVIGSFIVAGFAIQRAGGLGEIFRNVPSEIAAVPQGFGAAGVMTILLWGFSILPGTVTNQMYYQRIFAAKNVREGRQGIYIAA